MLKFHIEQNKIDLIGVTESWLSSDIQDSLFSLNNYVIFRRDRIGRGGGIFLADEQLIKSKLIHCSKNLKILAIDLITNPSICVIIT